MFEKPLLIGTFDPDKWQSAYAVAVFDAARDGYVYRGSRRQGTRKKPGPWQTITGQLKLLDAWRDLYGVSFDRMLVVVETQAPNGPYSSDVEVLRRMRYHLQAACEFRKVPCKFVAIAWADRFVPGAKRRGKAAQKKAYMSKAKEMTHGETTNEDQCAAFGMLVVEIETRGAELYIDST